MKILWNKNPLDTVIELESDHEREIFKLRLENNTYMWAVSGARFYLDGKHTSRDVERALSNLYDQDEFAERALKDYEMYLAYLSGPHCGDCTCFPASCSKCHAESILDIDTIQGLDKHSANRIQSLFRDNKLSVDEILHQLANPDYSIPNEHYRGQEQLWFSCVPRWTRESHLAHKWLKSYYEAHPEVLA